MTAVFLLLAVLVMAGVARCVWVLAYAASPQRQVDDRLSTLRRTSDR
jgi:hypothetical protein